MKKIITIGREFGAGGSSVGRQVAKELGIEYYDRDLILMTAEKSSHLTAEEIRKWDEKVPREFGLAQSLFNFYAKPLGEQLWDSQVKAIRNIAEKESCVIVGRNANYILREFDHTLRVFIHADEDWRLQHMMELMPEVPLSELKKQMNHIDKTRRNYSTHYTGRPYGFAGNFDMTFNSAKIGLDRIADIIVETAKNL